MKRKRENNNNRRKKLKECTIQNQFEKKEKQIEQLSHKLNREELKKKKLDDGLKYLKDEYFDGIEKQAKHLNTYLPKQLRDLHTIHYLDYKKMTMNILSRGRKSKDNLNNITKRTKKEIKKKEKELEKLKCRYDYKECHICRNFYKIFERNCLCKSDQYMCLGCIKNWTLRKIKENDKKGTDGILYEHVPCPFCKDEMKDFECPHCNKKNKSCKWCIKNKELCDLLDNFNKEIICIDD